MSSLGSLVEESPRTCHPLVPSGGTRRAVLRTPAVPRRDTPQPRVTGPPASSRPWACPGRARPDLNRPADVCIRGGAPRRGGEIAHDVGGWRSHEAITRGDHTKIGRLVW